MKETEQVLQQVERAISKVIDKFPATVEANIMTEANNSHEPLLKNLSIMVMCMIKGCVRKISGLTSRSPKVT